MYTLISLLFTYHTLTCLVKTLYFMPLYCVRPYILNFCQQGNTQFLIYWQKCSWNIALNETEYESQHTCIFTSLKKKRKQEQTHYLLKLYKSVVLQDELRCHCVAKNIAHMKMVYIHPPPLVSLSTIRRRDPLLP